MEPTASSGGTDAATRFARLVNRVQAGDHLDLLIGLIGASFQPSVDVGVVIRGLDDLASRCDRSFDGVMSSLFGTGLMIGNREDYHDPANSYLHEVIRRGLGMPITLSVVAVEVARRLDVLIEPIGLPGHFMVRDPATGRMGDPFNGGRVVAASEAEEHWQRLTGTRDRMTAAMLLPAPSRTIALRILNNLRVALLQRPDNVADRIALATLARLRDAFPELAAGERREHQRWLSAWN